MALPAPRTVYSLDLTLTLRADSMLPLPHHGWTGSWQALWPASRDADTAGPSQRGSADLPITRLAVMWRRHRGRPLLWWLRDLSSILPSPPGADDVGGLQVALDPETFRFM